MRYNSTVDNTIAAIFDKKAIATVILQKLAAILSSPHKEYTSISDADSQIIRNILQISNGKPNLSMQLYLLQQIQPAERLFVVLKSDLLAKLGLNKWSVRDGILF